MTNNNKFRFICDTIWYDDMQYWSDEYWYYRWYKCDMSEKDMIFSQEFMNCFIDYCLIKGIEDKWFAEWLLENLDNPVDYLFNLIKE